MWGKWHNWAAVFIRKDKNITCNSEPIISLDTLIGFSDAMDKRAVMLLSCILIGRGDVSAAEKHHLGPIKTELNLGVCMKCSHVQYDACNICM